MSGRRKRANSACSLATTMPSKAFEFWGFLRESEGNQRNRTVQDVLQKTLSDMLQLVVMLTTDARDSGTLSKISTSERISDINTPSIQQSLSPRPSPGEGLRPR